MSLHRVPEAGNGWRRVVRPALKRSKASFWPPISCSKGCCFLIRLPLEFRHSYVMSPAVGTVFYAWMLWCLSRKPTCKSAVCSLPWDHKTAQLDNTLCQSTRGCPWVLLSERGSPSLTWPHHLTANRWGKMETVTDFILGGSKITVDNTAATKLRHLPLEEKQWET